MAFGHGRIKSAAVILGILSLALSVIPSLFHKKGMVSRLTETGASFERTYDFSDFRSREHRIYFSIPRDSVEQTEVIFGISRADLRQILDREAERLSELYPGRIKVEIDSDLSYSCQYREDSTHLVREFRSAYEEAIHRYYSDHFIKKINSNTLQVDYAAMQRWQAPYVRPVYDALHTEARNSSMNERDFITFMSNFVQQIPYKTPPDSQNGRQIFGVWPPLISLKENAGDCDTKSTLFATIYTHYRKNGCILILTPRHAFIGIKDQHQVFPRDRITRIGGREYLLVEMTAPSEMGKVSPRELSNIRNGRFRYLAFH